MPKLSRFVALAIAAALLAGCSAAAGDREDAEGALMTSAMAAYREGDRAAMHEAMRGLATMMDEEPLEPCSPEGYRARKARVDYLSLERLDVPVVFGLTEEARLVHFRSPTFMEDDDRVLENAEEMDCLLELGADGALRSLRSFVTRGPVQRAASDWERDLRARSPSDYAARMEAGEALLRRHISDELPTWEETRAKIEAQAERD